MITKQELQQYLQTSDVDVLLFESLPSTNEYAATYAAQTNRTTAIIALEQTAGKGTKGRGFYCKNGEGLYLSLLFFPKFGVKTAQVATPAAGVAVAEAIEQVAGISAKIKWVNDIVIDDRKVCGILAESRITPGQELLDYLVIGIGINLAVKTFPPELKKIATSLDCYNASVDPNVLCAAVIDNVCNYIGHLVDRTFLAAYKARSSVLNRFVLFDNGGITVTGQAVDINREGGLVVDVNGKYYIINAGDVSIRVS